MDAYTFLKFIHVFLAITAVGGNITYGDGLWPVRVHAPAAPPD